jgi:BarA-like signal transduction histidine kinase
VNHVFIEQLWAWGLIEDAGSATLMVGEIVSTAGIQVLYIDCIAARPHIDV